MNKITLDKVNTSFTIKFCLLKDGTMEWRLNDQVHREDGPAVISPNGDEFWFCHGRFHRIGGPAIKLSSGYQAWYSDGELHRVNGPAVRHDDGSEEWWENGLKSLPPENKLLRKI